MESLIKLLVGVLIITSGTLFVFNSLDTLYQDELTVAIQTNSTDNIVQYIEDTYKESTKPYKGLQYTGNSTTNTAEQLISGNPALYGVNLLSATGPKSIRISTQDHYIAMNNFMATVPIKKAQAGNSANLLFNMGIYTKSAGRKGSGSEAVYSSGFNQQLLSSKVHIHYLNDNALAATNIEVVDPDNTLTSDPPPILPLRKEVSVLILMALCYAFIKRQKLS